MIDNTANHPVTEDDIHRALERLARSGKGRQAIADLLTFFDRGALSLDGHNQQAIATLMRAVWGPFPGTARELMRDVLAHTSCDG